MFLELGAALLFAGLGAGGVAATRRARAWSLVRAPAPGFPASQVVVDKRYAFKVRQPDGTLADLIGQCVASPNPPATPRFTALVVSNGAGTGPFQPETFFEFDAADVWQVSEGGAAT